MTSIVTPDDQKCVGFLLCIPAHVRIIDLEAGFAALAAATGCDWECIFSAATAVVPSRLHLYPETQP